MNESHHKFSNTKVVLLLAFLTCFLGASAMPAIKMGYALFAIDPIDIPSKLVFAGWRFMCAGLVIMGIASVLFKKKVFQLDPMSWVKVASLGIFQTTIQYIFFYIGLAHTTGVKGSILNGSVAFFGVLLSHFAHKNDKLTWNKIVGCLLGFAGVVVVNYNPELLSMKFTVIGDGFVIIAGFVVAAAMLYGKAISLKVDPVVMTAHQMTLGGGLLLGLGYVLGGHLSGSTKEALFLLAYLIALSSVSTTIWSVLMKYNASSTVTSFNSLVPVFGTILSSLILGEQIMQWSNGAALLCVCTGIWMVAKDSLNLNWARIYGRFFQNCLAVNTKD